MAGAALTALGTVLALAALVGPASAAMGPGPYDPSNPDTYGNPEFCTLADPINDFGLSQLPRLHEVPPFGDLPFGPKTVGIDFFSGPIITPGGSIGFWLSSKNFHGHTPLHWALRNRIRAVDAAGSPGKVLSRGSQRVRLINAAREVKLFLEPPRTPDFYLYEIEIVDFDGRHLATYSSHLRVERRSWNPRLGLNGSQFQPGDRVLNRIENFGTEYIAFGEEFRLQRYVDGAWAHRPLPGVGGWLLWLGYASAGRAGWCGSLDLPHTFPPGQYRIVKEVGRGSWPSGGRSQFLTAPFEVVP